MTNARSFSYRLTIALYNENRIFAKWSEDKPRRHFRRAPNFSTQKHLRIHLRQATTTRNWLGSECSFADVTMQKRKNKTVNGKRGA